MFDYHQTMFVGIDVSKDYNQFCFINFERKVLLIKSFKNNLEGANSLNDLNKYSTHIQDDKGACGILVLTRVKQKIFHK